MKEDNKVVRVKLVKHEWPDERAARKQKQKAIFLKMLIGACLFVGGFGVATFVNRGANTSIKNDSKYSVIHNVMSQLWYFGKDKENLEDQLMDGAINGMVDAGGDIHTQYMDRETASKFLSSLEGKFAGIGAQYSVFNGKAELLNIFYDSPAEKAGLLANDKIIKVDGIAVAEIEDLGKVIKGEAGTKVVVTIERGDEIFDVEIIRGDVDSSVQGEIMNNVGILTISAFAENSANSVKMYLERFKEANVNKLIIDLRNNGGGYLTTVVEIGSYLMPNNLLVLQEETRDGKITEYKTKNNITPFEFDEMVVMVNEDTASASEVLTAALRENMDVEVVGVKTYGKGTVQKSVTFKDGSLIKYTTAQWLTPKNNKIDGVGITPDYLVDLPLAARVGIVVEGEFAVDSVSEECMIAQIYLQFLGYDVDRSDGYFSEKTLAALNAFERDMKIDIGKVINQTNMEALMNARTDKWLHERNTLDTQFLKAMEVISGK